MRLVCTQVMYPAEHSEVLTQVDRIPIVNKKGTQYFMDVGIGTPRFQNHPLNPPSELSFLC